MRINTLKCLSGTNKSPVSFLLQEMMGKQTLEMEACRWIRRKAESHWISAFLVVGITGLEPATSRPPDVCATNCAKSRSSLLPSSCIVFSVVDEQGAYDFCTAFTQGEKSECKGTKNYLYDKEKKEIFFRIFEKYFECHWPFCPECFMYASLNAHDFCFHSCELF